MAYVSTIWDPVSQKHIQILEQVQRRTARYVFNSYTDGTPGCVIQMVKDLNWESLENRRSKHCLCMLYSSSDNLVDVKPDTYLKTVTGGHARFFQERTEFPGYRNSFSRCTIRDPVLYWKKNLLLVPCNFGKSKN